MKPLYKEILAHEPVVPTDPATRKPLIAAAEGVGMRKTENAAHCCNTCKWGAPDNQFLDRGKCMALKNKLGAIWQRAIPDYFNMVCDRFEEGEINFREHV